MAKKIKRNHLLHFSSPNNTTFLVIEKKHIYKTRPENQEKLHFSLFSKFLYTRPFFGLSFMSLKTEDIFFFCHEGKLKETILFL